MALDRDLQQWNRPQEVILLEDHLKKLQSRLDVEAKADDPILQEIERIVCWLEMFNTLFKGLIQMNRIIEKSSSCHQKLNRLLKHRGDLTKCDSHERDRDQVTVPSDRKSSTNSEKSSFVSAKSIHSASSGDADEEQEEVFSSDKSIEDQSDTMGELRDSLATRVSAVLNRTAFPIEDMLRNRREVGRNSTSRPRSHFIGSTGSSSLKSSDGVDTRLERTAPKEITASSTGYPHPRREAVNHMKRRNASSSGMHHVRGCSPSPHNAAAVPDVMQRQTSTSVRPTAPSVSGSSSVSVRSGPIEGRHKKPYSSVQQGRGRREVRLQSDYFNGNHECWFIPLNGQPDGDRLESLQHAFDRKCSIVKQRSMKRSDLIKRRAEFRRVAHENLIEDCRNGCAYRLTRQQRQELGESMRRPVAQMPPSKCVKMKRIFTHQEMRSQTEKIYRNLPEVKEREKEVHKEAVKQTHEIMKHIFTNKVQQNSLRGRVHFPITKNFVCY